MTKTNTTIAVVGLGYVGLPLAVEFGKQFKTIGFDMSESKIAAYRRGVDPTGEVSGDELAAALAEHYVAAHALSGRVSSGAVRTMRISRISARCLARANRSANICSKAPLSFTNRPSIRVRRKRFAFPSSNVFRARPGYAISMSAIRPSGSIPATVSTRSRASPRWCPGTRRRPSSVSRRSMAA